MHEAIVADRRLEVDNGCTLPSIAQRRESVFEEALERHPFRRPGVEGHVLEFPLDDELRKAGARAVVQVELPRRRELRARRLVVEGGHILSLHATPRCANSS